MESGVPSPGFGQLLRRAALPERVSCLASLGGGCVAAGTPTGVEVVAWGGAKPVKASGFAAECLAALGSQSLAAGDTEGRVRVWHLRRGALKQVYDVPAHTQAVRALANAGDVLLTASEDGTLRELDVLAGFAPTEFAFSAGVAVSFVAASGRFALLAGCSDGRVVEVHRKTSQQMRCLELGPNLAVLAADEADGRVLAAGDGRLEVWRLPAPPKGRRASEVGLSDPTLLGAWPIPGVSSGLLLPGGDAKDFIVGSRDGVMRGPSDAPLVPEAANGRQCVDAMALAFRDDASPWQSPSSPASAFVVLGGGAKASGGKGAALAELFELELSVLRAPPTDSGDGSRAAAGGGTEVYAPLVEDTVGTSAKAAGSGAMEAVGGKHLPGSGENAAPTTATLASQAGAQGQRSADSPSPHTAAACVSHYWDATQASRARAETAARSRS